MIGFPATSWRFEGWVVQAETGDVPHTNITFLSHRVRTGHLVEEYLSSAPRVLCTVKGQVGRSVIGKKQMKLVLRVSAMMGSPY